MKQQIKTNKMEWGKIELGEVLDYEQPTKYIVESTDYKDEYETPVLTAGKSFILGYTNENKGIRDKLPVIIFDDFTTDKKFVDFKFKVKSSAMKILKPKNELINLKFVFFAMNQLNFDAKRHKRYYLSAYQNLKIPMPFIDGKPDIKTQNKIVAILEEVEKLKEKREKSDKLTKEYLQSVFYEIFGDPNMNPKKWPIINIEEVAIDKKGSIRMGPFGSQLKKHELTNKGVKVLWIENIVGNKFNPDGTKYITDEKYEQLKGFTVNKGDLIITMMGTIGGVEIVPDIGEAIISSHLLKIEVNKKICNPIYLKKTIMSPFVQNQFKDASHGAIMSGLNGGIIKSTKIPLPPIELQQKFASIVEKVERLQLKQIQSKEEINLMFDSLITQAFNGELVK